MKVKLCFDSMEEFREYRIERIEQPEDKLPDQEPEEKPEPEKKPAKRSKPAMSEPEPEEKTEPAEETDYEALRAKTRTVLARLNKTVPGKPAKGLIQAYGVDRLDDVPGENLPELIAKAEEAINA